MRTDNDTNSTTEVWIDSTVYPQILSTILQVSPLPLLRKLRNLSRRCHDEVDRLLLSRLVVGGTVSFGFPRIYADTVLHDRVGFLAIDRAVYRGYETDEDHPFTYTGTADLSHTRMLDIRGSVRLVMLANLPLPPLEVLRIWTRWSRPDRTDPEAPSDPVFTSTFSLTNEPPRHIPCSARRLVHFATPRTLHPTRGLLRLVPDGLQELVINLAYHPAEQWLPSRSTTNEWPSPPPTLRSATIIFTKSEAVAKLAETVAKIGGSTSVSATVAPAPNGAPADLGAAIATLGVPVLLVGFEEFAAPYDPQFTLESLRAGADQTGSETACWEVTTMSPRQFRESVGEDDWDLFTREFEEDEVETIHMWDPRRNRSCAAYV